jgi:tetratricopeptide (TPR) repeat protein
VDAGRVTQASPSAGRLSGGKRAAFTLAALALPVVFFLLLEGALRLVGYGDSYPLFVDVEEVEGIRVQNADLARRYFYGQQTVPTGLQDYFAAQKSDSTFRLVVQGGSTAAGFPFYAGGAFSRMLETRLQLSMPNREVEVINTALAAVNSFTLLDLADEILETEPDAVLIYAGHNEYYGALGAGSSVSLGSSPALVRIYLRLQRLRTVQLVRDGLAAIAGVFAGADEEQNTTLMSRMVQEESIALGSDTYTAGLRAFEQNMALLLKTYQQAGVPVYLSTIASNERDHAPFVTLTAQPDTRGRLAQAQTLLAQTRIREAAEAFAVLDRDDPLCAACSYGLGQSLERLGDEQAAAQAYQRARDRDGLRFRASSEVNAIIRALASRYDAVLVDAEQSMRDRSPGGSIGREMMVEHLHPQPAGFFAIADAFYDALAQQVEMNPVGEQAARQAGVLTPVDSLVGVYRVLQLTSVWPFEPVGVRKPYLDTLKARTAIDSLAQQLFEREIAWIVANERQRVHFAGRGDNRLALQAARAQIQEYPFDASGYLAAGGALTASGRLQEALSYYRKAVDRAPSSTGFMMIGSIYLQEGDAQKALAPLEKALELETGNVQARYNLAGALALTGQLQQARDQAERVLELAPGHPGARNLIAQLPSSGAGAP